MYEGASAKVICESKLNDKNLYLFDTFIGTPKVSFMDTKLKEGWYESNYNDVKKYLSKYPNTYFYKGLFPEETGEKIKNKKFCFVHLDCDIYKSIFDSLKFFYPKMMKEGIFLIHDYTRARGVKIAVDKFFKNKPERIIRLAESQVIIIKK